MQRAMSMAVVSIGVYLGQFLSPVVLKFAGSISVLSQDPFRAQFNFLAFGLAVSAVIALIIAFKNRKNYKAAENLPVHH
jgi:hypothetical protein